MFITFETPEGAEATVNTAYVTHVTQVESAYPEAGSFIYFTSERALQVKPTVSQICRMLANDGDDEASEPQRLLVRPG
jgi:hypothetical protein